MNDWKRRKLIKFILKQYSNLEIIHGSKHDQVKDKGDNKIITTIPRHSKIKAPTTQSIFNALKNYYSDKSDKTF